MLDRVPYAREALHGLAHVGGAVEETDALMPERQEVLDRQCGARAVVDGYGWQARGRVCRVKEHDRGSLGSQARRGLVRGVRRGEQDAAHRLAS